MTKPKFTAQMDSLESRTLLHGGFGHGGFGGFGEGDGGGRGHLHIPANPDAAVTADLANITADRAQLKTDRSNLESTLETDEQAIHDAIVALQPTLAPLQTTFQQDAQTWRATLRTDRDAIHNATDDTTRQAAIAQFKADKTSGQAVLLADAQAIRDVITNDPGVTAAKAQLTTDSQLITDDKTKLAADFTQLQTDIAAQNAAAGTSGTTASHSSKHRRH